MNALTQALTTAGLAPSIRERVFNILQEHPTGLTNDNIARLLKEDKARVSQATTHMRMASMLEVRSAGLPGLRAAVKEYALVPKLRGQPYEMWPLPKPTKSKPRKGKAAPAAAPANPVGSTTVIAAPGEKAEITVRLDKALLAVVDGARDTIERTFGFKPSREQLIAGALSKFVKERA